MTTPVVRLEDVSRSYGEKRVLRSLSFELPEGGVTALLGRNGAGKTTALRILLGFEKPTRGRVEVFGRDSLKLRPVDRDRIGYVPEGHPLPGDLRVEEYQRFDAAERRRFDTRFFGAVLGHFHVDPRQRIRTLSRGQRAGVSLALAMASEPDLLILDDPSLGLDIVARRSFLESVVHVAEQGGRTILLSTHLIDEVERLADRMLILDGGRLRADCPVECFASSLRRVEIPESRRAEAESWPGLLRLTSHGENLQATTLRPEGKDPTDDLPSESLSLEEALHAFLGEPGEQPSFFDSLGQSA